MKRVTGIGGIFLKSKDPESLREWYREHLGIESEGDSAASSIGAKWMTLSERASLYGRHFTKHRLF
jgi:hypothetical protein